MTITMHTHGNFVIQMLSHLMTNQSTKFEVSSFSHSWDMNGAPKIEKGACNVTIPVRNSLSSISWKLLQ